MKVRSLLRKVISPIRTHFRPDESQILAAAKLRSIASFDPNDIFIVGYPKSGNTWMQNLVAGLMYGIDMRLTPDTLVQDLVPDVHAVRYYRRHLTPTFFKTHELPRPDYRRVVYLVRDGRDAMVSYFHFLEAINGRPPDFLKLVTTGEGLYPCRWHEHVEAWRANPYGAQMMTLSYEELKQNAGRELQRLCIFAGLERDQSLLEAVVHSASFNMMREKEKKTGWDDGGAWPADRYFVRRGKVGSFRDEMPPPILESFMQQSEGTLKMLGYI